MSISFKFTEDKIQEPAEHEIRIQADKPNSFGKKFANTTWEVVYREVKEGYDKGEFKAYYEQRDPNKPCNFHVDIDDEVPSFNDELYLKQIREDFNACGITEPWKVQRAHGTKGTGYKVSYHITIPGVRFESNKHLKRWFSQRCTKIDNVGQDKNGRKTNKAVYKLGRTKIDTAVYCKGAWRFPLCAKEGSSRVLEYTEPMTFKVFKELSIHHIEDDARTIQVELPKTSIKKKRSFAVSAGNLTDDEKERYKLEGDFVWGQQRENGIYIKATSDVWRCPFDAHKKNRQVSVCGNELYCHGCQRTYSITKKQRGLWELPTLEFFSDYFEDYESKYGIARDAPIGTDDAFLASLFMNKKGKTIVYCGQWYVQNEFGLYKSPTHAMAKVVKNFFVEFLENSERIFKLTSKKIQEHTNQGNKASSHPEWNQYCNHRQVIRRLKSNKSRAEILKEIQCEVTNNEFERDLDKDPYLLGFENGVMDLSTMEFRKGRPNEYVSLSCGYPYQPKTEEECKEWLCVFRELYRSQEEMDWDWKEMARSLVGINKEEIAKFELGPGGNGKGLKATVEQQALGDYCKTLSSSCVLKTKYTVRNGHDISLYSARRARRWQLSELNEQDILDTEQFKRYTGNDLIEMRTHQQKEMEYRIAPPITFSLNNPIRMAGSNERSMQRRVICLFFNKKFVTQTEYDELDASKRENVDVADTSLKEKVKDDDVKCIIMSILLRYYQRYKREGLEPPVSMRESTKTFLERACPLTIWFNENLEVSPSNILKNDLLAYYNDQNGTNVSKTQFGKLLKEHRFEVLNTRGFTLCKVFESWNVGDKRKGMCVTGVRIKNLDTIE
jgi:phage/plasmid-associated DNA primase